MEGDPIPPPLILLEYYTLTFQRLGAENVERIRKNEVDIPRRFRLKHFSPMVDGLILPPDRAWPLLRAYLDEIEMEIRELLSTHSVFYWIHLSRRISPRLSPWFHNQEPTTALLVRQIMDLAILKHGNLGKDDDVRLSSSVVFRDILGGHCQVDLTRAYGSERASSIFEEIRARREWVLTAFSLADFLAIARLKGFSYEYWRVTAALRTVGKGSSIGAADDGWINYIPPSPSFPRLIQSLDERNALYGGESSLVGLNSNVDPTQRSFIAAMVIATYNVTGDVEAFQNLARLAGVESNAGFEPNFNVGIIDLKSYYEVHRFLSRGFSEVYRQELRLVLLGMWAIGNRSMLSGGMLDAILPGDGKNDSDDTSARRGPSPLFLALLHLSQRGYLTIDSREDLPRELEERARRFQPGLFTEGDDLAPVVEFLTLDDRRSREIGLWSGGRWFPVIRYGDELVVDTRALQYMLANMFFRVRSMQTERGSVFENAFRERLVNSGYEVILQGDVYNRHGKNREIDAAVRVGNSLVLFECRSMERPLDIEIGKPSSLKKRIDDLDEKVEQVLTLRDFLVADPCGRNYDVSWTTEIVPLVVSPFVEWIWEHTPRLWQDGKTPRIVSVSEAIAFLEQTESKGLKRAGRGAFTT